MNVGEFKKLLAEAPDDTDIESLLPQKEVVKVVVPEMALQIPIEGAVAHIKHSCNPGDIVASMIAIKRYYELTNRKTKFLQSINFKANYYHGAKHGTVDEKGQMVTLNKRLFDMIKPLVESQPYIDSFEQYDGQRIDIDFDVIRGKTFVNMPQGSIQGWLFYAFPDLAADISKPWLTLDPQRQQIEEVTKGKVILNFTDRYRNARVVLDYFFLRNYAPDLIFAGTETEHFQFCNQWGLHTIPLLETKDFLEVAYAVRGGRFLLSNQSFMWNLSTSLGTNRLLEVCDYAHNCMPFYGSDADGKFNNLGFFHQAGLEYWFREMYKNTKNK